MRKTEIMPWTNDWMKSYKEEEERLKDVLREEVVHIYHIGSTSIPTIRYAKPIIDILIVVKDIHKIHLYNEKMVALGYIPKGENGIVGRRYFPKGMNLRTYHVHVFQVGSEQIKAHLNFKEYLLMNPDEAKKYGELKVRLAEQFPNEHQKYQDGKQKFVTHLADKAIEWASKRECTNPKLN